MKTKEELEEATKIPSQSTRGLFLVWIPQPVWRAWMNFKSSRSLIKKCMIKG